MVRGPHGPEVARRDQRRPARFADMLLACECDARGRLGFEDRDYPQRARLLRALALARAVDTSTLAERLAAEGRPGPQIGAAIHAARVAALRCETGD